MTPSRFLTIFSTPTTVAEGCQAVATVGRWRLLLVVIASIVAMAPSLTAGGELEDKLAEICKAQNVPGIIAASIGPDGVIESAVAGVRKR